MSDVVPPTQFTAFGTGEKIVMTVRSNNVRVSPRIRVLLLRLMRMKSSERTTMNSNVGRRGMTSAETAITTNRPEQNLGQWTTGASPVDEGQARAPVLHYSIDIFLSKLKSVSICPVPRATQASGSSARVTGRPVS